MRNKNSQNVDTELLYRAILSLKTMDECKDFFETLCTVQEIHSFAQRFTVAKMLNEDCVYSQIMNATGASTATISRVNRSLNFGDNGFNQVFDRIQDNE